MILKFIKSKIYKVPLRIKAVYLYYEMYCIDKSEYSVNLWKGVEWKIGSKIPMFLKGNIVVFYEITRQYYKIGNSMSDWAFGDDGRYRDFLFSHIIAKTDIIKAKEENNEL